MSQKTITVTSKNQITIPSSYVKQLGITKSRVITAELKGGTIILTPQTSLGTSMQKFWGRHQAVEPVSDAELKLAIQTITAKKAA